MMLVDYQCLPAAVRRLDQTFLMGHDLTVDDNAALPDSSRTHAPLIALPFCGEWGHS
jgi:hypothetical protein